MSKEELKELLKENLSVEIYASVNRQVNDVLNIRVFFDGDVICKDSVIIDNGLDY